MWAGSRVLVVDDNSGVRSVARRALEDAGCTVLNASDGAHALEILDRQNSDIDLVLTDINMPRLNGLELGRRIARMTPPIPVVYMSAELPDALVGGDANLTFPPFLLKPLSIETLVAAVIGLLAGSGAYRGRAADRLEVEQGENLT